MSLDVILPFGNATTIFLTFYTILDNISRNATVKYAQGTILWYQFYSCNAINQLISISLEGEIKKIASTYENVML